MIENLVTLLFNKLGLTSVAFIIILWAGWLVFSAWRYRLRGGKFNITPAENGFTVDTDLGKFLFDQKEQKVFFEYRNGLKTDLSFSQIKSVTFKKDISSAQLEEFLLDDFSILDTSIFGRDYIDQYRSYILEVFSRDGEGYPIFACTQYRVKDLWDICNALFLGLLSKLKLYQDVDIVGEGAYKSLRQYMRGLPFELRDFTL